jgi:hypothetical protein
MNRAFGSMVLGRIVRRPLAAFAPITGRSWADIRHRRTETEAHWVLYVGRGDRFDDDRRLIRAADDAAEAA